MENKTLLNYFSMQVNLYFDNRLTDESKENLLNVVNQDPDCSQVFNKEKSQAIFNKMSQFTHI